MDEELVEVEDEVEGVAFSAEEMEEEEEEEEEEKEKRRRTGLFGEGMTVCSAFARGASSRTDVVNVVIGARRS